MDVIDISSNEHHRNDLTLQHSRKIMSTKHLLLSLALAACTAALPAHAGKVPLSDSSMAQIHGGLAVESFTNPAASFQVVDRENMQLSGSFSEALNANEVVISVFAGESKIGAQMVSTGAPDANGVSRGNFAFRSNAFSDFPIGNRAGKDLTVRFLVPASDRPNNPSCNPDPNVACILQAGNSERFPRNGIRLDDNVIVNRVRIFNLTDGTQSTFLDPSTFSTLIDNEEFTQDRLFNPSIDNVLAQCTGARRVQLRLDNNYDRTAFLQVPTGCTRQSSCPGGFDFYNTLARRNPGIFHIFVLNELGGENVIGRAFVGNSNFITIRQNLDPTFLPPLLTTATIAHEIGHTRGLNHAGDDQTNCNATETEAVRRSTNVMCPTISSPFVSNGRLVGGPTFLNAGQCNLIRSSSNTSARPYAPDIN